MKKICLTQGRFALVDEEDFEYLIQRKWHVQKGRSTFYAIANKGIFPKPILMHRMVLNAPAGTLVDHINGNGLDNRRENLRLCTPHENQRNHKLYSTNKTGFKGVSAFRNKFKATIGFENRQIFIGLFTTPQEAAKAYDKAALKYFGEFANINFSKDDYA